MKQKSLFTLVFLLLSGFAFGQGSTAAGNPVATDPQGRPLPGISVAVCSSNPGTTTPPCQTLVATFTDITLVTPCTGVADSQPLNNQSNPTVATGCSNPGLTDNLGNAVIFAASGNYWCQFYSPRVKGYVLPCTFPGTGGGGAAGIGTPNQINVVAGVISLANPALFPGAVVSNGPIGASNVSNGIYAYPDPYCAWQGVQALQDLIFCNLQSIGPVFNPGDGSQSLAYQLVKIPTFGYQNGQVMSYHPNGLTGADWEPASQVQVFDTNINIKGISVIATPGIIPVSRVCGDPVTCNGFADVSAAMASIVNSVGNNTVHLLYDMCGDQTFSVQPFPAGTTGVIEWGGNCQQIWDLDGMSSLLIPSGLRIIGNGANSFAQTPTNSYIKGCNNAIQDCAHGGFVTQHATVSSTVVAGTNMTITVAGTPFSVQTDCSASTGTATSCPPNSVAAGRELCIYGATTQPTNNSCWVVTSITQTTAPQKFVVSVVNGVTVSCTPGTCGTVYLETPLVMIGTGGGNSSFHASISDVTLDCNYNFASGGFVNGQGEEATGTHGNVQVFNCMTYDWRFDQSQAYAGLAGGDTNSMGSDALEGNVNPVFCSKAAGCSCANAGVANCSAGNLVAAGTGNNNRITVGLGTTIATLLVDPSVNGNFVCSLVTGASGNQGPGRFKGHLTCSISDKSQGGGTPIPQLRGGSGSAGGTPTTGIGFAVLGSSGQFDHTHAEYFDTAYEICGNSARNATWEQFYGTIPTAGVHFDGAFSAFNSGKVGIDIGQAGNAATCVNIRFDGMNIGLGGATALSDNINGNTCNDQTITYEIGNATNPVLANTCSTGKGSVQLPRFMVKGTAPTCAFTSGGGTGSPTCTVDTGSTDTAGIMVITTGTTAAGTGTVTLTFSSAAAFGTNKPTCQMAASDNASAWANLATFRDKTPSTTTDLFTWVNGTVPTALTNTSAYWINYHCWAK